MSSNIHDQGLVKDVHKQTGQQQLPSHLQGQQQQRDINIGGGREVGVHSNISGQQQRENIRQGAHEAKEQLMQSAEHGMEQVKKIGDNLSNMACDVCHNWRHYPKLLTGLLLLTTFLVGATSLFAIQRVGIIGSGSGNYVSQHWDRETADAHHALDVVLDHLQHPSLYRSEKSESYVNKARKSLFNLFDGFMPSSRSSSKSMMSKGRDSVGRKGQDMYDDARDTGRNIYDKAADVKDDIAYRTRRGVDSVKDSAYDLSHNIGNKISDIAGSVKNTFVGDDDSYMNPMSRRSDRPSSSPISSWKKVAPTWLGGFDNNGDDSYSNMGRSGRQDVMRRGNTDEDEFDQATSKLQHLARQAQRDM